MGYTIQSYAAIGSPFSEAQYISIGNGIAELLRKEKIITVPVSGIGQFYGIGVGLEATKTAKLSAEITIRAMLGFYENTRNSSFKLQLSEFILNSHRKLQQRAIKDQIPHLGSSLSMLWFVNESCYWGHVGDTKVLLLRDGELKQINPQHTTVGFARRDGTCPPEKEELAQAFIRGQLQEDSGSIRLDLGIDVNHLILQADDVFLLCSNYVYRSLGMEKIREILLLDPSAVTRKIANEVNTQTSDRLVALVATVED